MEFLSFDLIFMYQLIFDLITVRGWSVRHLSELTGISYSGIRDHLKGLPHRLSEQRLRRVYEILDLDLIHGTLKPNTLYTWRVELGRNQLSALNRVLRVTIELISMTSIPNESELFRFEIIPLIGGGNVALPAPYCVLRWQDIYIVVQWALPTRQQKNIANFHGQHESSGKKGVSSVNPDITLLNSASWVSGMEISFDRVIGIQLSPSQMAQLQASDAIWKEMLTLDALKKWIQAEPVEDTNWTSVLSKKNEWTWELILQSLQHRYSDPAQAAKALKLT